MFPQRQLQWEVVLTTNHQRGYTESTHMTGHHSTSDRSRQWCALSVIAGVVAVSMFLQLSGPSGGPPPRTAIQPPADVTLPATLMASEAPVSGVAVLPQRLGAGRRVTAARPGSRPARALSGLRPELASSPLVSGPAPIPAVVPSPLGPATSTAGPIAPLASHILIDARRGAFTAPTSPASQQIADAAAAPRRGPVVRALVRAGTETGRGFRRVGAALGRVF